jgi:ribosomal protein L11 methyltransferase
MAEQWRELSWVVPVELTEILGAELGDMGSLGAQEDYLEGEEPSPRQPWEKDRVIENPSHRILKVWFPQDSDIEEEFESLKSCYPSTGFHSWTLISEDDWDQDWKKHFTRFVISDALAVSPPWEAQEGDLIIEPGLAFGTGNHPTTHSCLEAIAKWANPGETCLDLGCGTGILALAAAKLGMESIGVDCDDDAIQASKQNAEINGLTAYFDTTPIEDLKHSSPLVVANLYAEVLVALTPHILPLVGRNLALAGILADRSHLVKDAFSTLKLIREQREGDWVSLWYCR